jgi:hypothetical protein
MTMNAGTPAPDLALELAISNLKGSMETKLAGIDGKLNMLIASDERTNAAVEELQRRVTELERTKWLAMGAGLVLGGGAGALVQLLGG